MRLKKQQEANQFRVSETRQFAVEFSDVDSLVIEEGPFESRVKSVDWTSFSARVFLGSFLSALVGVGLGYWLGTPAFAGAQWVGAVLLGLAVASTLISLARQLPWQNVLLGAVVIGLSGAAVEVIWISFGSGLRFYNSGHAAEPSFWLRDLWQLSLVWIVALLNCRGMVRLIMHRWRFSPSYGFWVLGGTVVLASVFILSFARFGPVQVDPRTAESVPGVTIGTLLTLVLVTPSLINKKPVPEKADWHPLVIWMAFNLWFVVEGVWQGG